MVTHTCPICRRAHAVPTARAEVAYGRQLTCSPECESARRRLMRRDLAAPTPPAKVYRPASRWQRVRESVSRVMHVWVIARTGADLVLTSSHLARGRLPHH